MLGAGFKLVPVVAETLGGWGPAAQGLFRVAVKATAEGSGVEDNVAVSQLYEAMAIKYRSILSRVSAASAAGRDNTALAATSRSEAALVLSAAVATSG